MILPYLVYLYISTSAITPSPIRGRLLTPTSPPDMASRPTQKSVQFYFNDYVESQAQPYEEADESGSSSDESSDEVMMFQMDGFENEPTRSPEERRERKRLMQRLTPPEQVEDINTPIFAKYAYSDKEYEEMGPKLSLFAKEQIAIDMINGPVFAPLLRNSMLEHLPADDGSVALLQLGPQLTTTAQSVVFEIFRHPNLVIKYQVDCDIDSPPVHPLLRDALFLLFLGETGLVPTIHYMSPPALMGQMVDKKTNFLMTAPFREECVKQNRSVRFLIMGRIEQNLYQYVEARGPNFYGAISLMKELLTGLRRMHMMGIVHGDIHPGNIGLVGDKAVFIDFGLAFHVEEKIGKPEKIRDRLGNVHCLFSHWDLEGYRSSFRDDAYKVVMIGAFLIQGQPFIEHIKKLEADGEEMMRFKRDAFLFEFPHSPSATASLTVGSGITVQIREHLQQLLDSVRSVHDINDLPDYDTLIGILGEILALLRA